MHKEILTNEQIQLLPLVSKFTKNFGLVGGTAIALHIGHRRSIDFDLFTLKEFDNTKVRKEIRRSGFKIDKARKDELGQFTIIISGVQLTFFHYPFKIKFSKTFENIIKMPDLLTLTAMKAYALGRRAKWKDYVDLYFILKNHYSIKKICARAHKIFGSEFNEKLFRSQLAYFKDIDYQEKVIYLKGFEVPDKVIKRELINFSLS